MTIELANFIGITQTPNKSCVFGDEVMNLSYIIKRKQTFSQCLKSYFIFTEAVHCDIFNTGGAL